MLSLSTLVPLLVVGGGICAVQAWALQSFYTSLWQFPMVALRANWGFGRAVLLYVARGCKPRFPDWTFAFEIYQSVMRDLFVYYGDRVVFANAQVFRYQTSLMGDAGVVSLHAQNKTRTEPFEFNGLEHLWIRSAIQPPAPQFRVVALYFHGSGHAVFSPRAYQPFASELQARLHRAICTKLGASELNIQVDVLLANYRKTPEHPYPQGPLDALAMYKYLLNQEQLSPQQIIIMGDSAGAGLTLTTMLRVRAEDPKLLPVASVLACPFVNREIKGGENSIPYCLLSDRLVNAFHAAYYQGEEKPTSWGDASPYHCDLQGLPPAYIQVGELDYLLEHATKLYEKAQATGLSTWTIEIVPHMPHAYTNVPLDVLPPAAKGIEAMAQYAATHLAASIKNTTVS